VRKKIFESQHFFAFRLALLLKTPLSCWLMALASITMLFVLGCRTDTDEVVRQKVSERVTAFRKKKSAECRDELLSTAEAIADSLLLEEAKASLGDSLSLTRPFKPLKPAPVPAIDTSPVRPLFKAASTTRGGR